MPTIRAIRPTDLVSLISFFRDDSHREVTARVWPEVWGDSDSRAVWDLLSRLLRRSGGAQVWVCLADGGLRGLALAHPRAGKLAWDVENLYVADGHREAGVDLLDHISVEASRKGARRIFLATPIDGEMSRIAGQAGFANYTSESLYLIQSPAPAGDCALRSGRPRLRQDTQALFQLYNAAVPYRVRCAEAMTMDEWSSLERGSRPWAPSLGGNPQHFVWEENGLVGWLRLTCDSRSRHLDLLVHPSHRTAVEEMLLCSLNQASHRAPIYVSARDYQPELVSALESRGFARAADHLVFARELTVRVPHRVLVPVRA